VLDPLHDASNRKGKYQRTLTRKSNGEVEGPDDHARQAPRAHNLARVPRR
jgi:hypothetical protein